MAILKHGMKLNKATVYSNDILGKGSAIPNTAIKPTEIAIHNTGNWDVPSNNYHRSLKRENGLANGRQASWHFSVDEKEIWQSVDTARKVWAVGNGNSYTISIEICMFKDKNKQKLAEDNAIALVKELQRIYKIPTSKVKMHKDYTGKYCPQVILDRDGNLNKFRQRIDAWGKDTSAPSTGFKNGDIQKDVVVLVDALNVRSGRGTNYPIIGKLKKGDTVNLWYCMNNWSSMERKFKDKNGNKVDNFICLHQDGTDYVKIK